MPLVPGFALSPANMTQFVELMYRPLYWYGTNGAVQLNPSLSLAYPPVYSSDGKTVTIKLKNWDWSDRTPITARDVEFWLNLVTANKSKWASYIPGSFPDTIASVHVVNDHTISLTTTKAFSHQWFTYNQLSQIIPIPQHVWDKTSTSGHVSNYDTTSAGAEAVYKYLNAQAMDQGTYASNPLWRVVDGPWKLTAFTSDGAATFVPNANYSGPEKPKISQFKEVPFTSGSAELNAVRAHAVDYGYLPLEDLPQVNEIKSLGYSVQPWDSWAYNYVNENFGNPQVGNLLKQLYLRQAIQSLVNQPEMIRSILHGYGVPNYGPIPASPANAYANPALQQNPYPYDPTKAINLLKAHGWTVSPASGSVCSKPGTGAGECGASIPAGTRLTFELQYTSGITYLDQEMQALKSSLGLAGIDVSLKAQPFNTVAGAIAPCSKGAACPGQLSYWGSGYVYLPNFYPTGELLFRCPAYNNYCNPQMDVVINTTLSSNSLTDLHAYDSYAAQQVPEIFMPLADYQISVISSTLHGAGPQDILQYIYPENWYRTR
jgi:peptide/nickel transport system substrate-binding protein